MPFLNTVGIEVINYVILGIVEDHNVLAILQIQSQDLTDETKTKDDRREWKNKYKKPTTQNPSMRLAVHREFKII